MIMTSCKWRQRCRLHLRPPSGLWNEASGKSVLPVVSNHASRLGSVLNIKSGSDLHPGHCVSEADLLVWEGKLAMDGVITMALKQLPPKIQFKARYTRFKKKKKIPKNAAIYACNKCQVESCRTGRKERWVRSQSCKNKRQRKTKSISKDGCQREREFGGEGSRVRGEYEKWSFVERRAEKRERQEVTGGSESPVIALTLSRAEE